MTSYPENAPSSWSNNLQPSEAIGVSRRRMMLYGGAGLVGLAATTVAGQVNTNLTPSSETLQASMQQPQENASGKQTISEKLQGKVAVITGAARGIGRACAVAMAQEGADIVALDIAQHIPILTGYRLSTPEELNKTEELVKAQGRRCLTIQGDVRNMEAMRRMAERTIEELGKIDILVANAGVAVWKPFASMTDEQWNVVIDVNLTGAANSMRAVLPHMIERKQGRIIAISSIGGRTGVAGVSNYAATKWALIGLVKSMALELGSQNITVNAVCPTAVNTPLYRSEGQRRSMLPKSERPTAAEQDEMMFGYHPLPVPALEPEAIADGVVFLASDEAKYISGAAIDIAAGGNARYTA